MSITRRLQISMAMLVALSTLLLGLGQQSALLSLLAILAAATSLVFTDILGWIRLNKVVANLAAIGVAVFSLWDFFRDTSHEQLLAIATLLSLLLVVLMFQEKNSRLYWQIAVLSLLQVVVAAVLNLGLLFGVLLLVYALNAISALMLFFVEREATRLAEAQTAAAAKRHVAGQAYFFEIGRRPSGARKRATLAMPPVAFQPVERAILERPFLGGGLLWQISSFCATTMIFSLVLFYCVPRIGASVWQGPSSGRIRQSGFSQQVSLDQMGEILQNREMVLRASFTDPNTGQPYLVDTPYLRGAILTDYVREGGRPARWEQFRLTNRTSGRRLEALPGTKNVVRQEVAFATSALNTDPGSEPPALFSVYPCYALPDTPDSLRQDRGTQQLFRIFSGSDDHLQSGQYRYALGTTAFRGGWQSPVTPHLRRANQPDTLRNRSGAFNAQRHAGVAETATAILSQKNLLQQGARERALALAEHFLDQQAITREGTSPPYTYSLRPDDAQRNANLDPIEDFVVNHRTGHCEYFASALAMMLRSQGIPARLVIGYKGGEYNSLGNYWQVRQSNAHAWVEAYLEPGQASTESLDPQEDFSAGIWLRLDPTPPTSVANEDLNEEGLWDRFWDTLDYAQFLWTDYVVGLNAETQRRSIYDPVPSGAAGSFAGLFDFASWREFFASASRSVGVDARSWRDGNWFSWRAALVAVTVCLAVVGLVRAVSSLQGRLQMWKRRRRDTVESREGIVVAFYQRLAAILADRGIERRLEQTQLEFAADAGGRLATLPLATVGAADAIAPLPNFIVERFYHVRFGGVTLDKDETDQIEHALDTLDQSLTQ